MPVKHKKNIRRKGDKALARLRAEMEKTADAIREAEQLASVTDGPGLPREELTKRFPALGNVR